MIIMAAIFGAGMLTAVVCILIGFLMGKSVIFGNATVLPKAKSFNPGPVSEPEGDYFAEEFPDYSDPAKRVSTL